MFQKQDSLQAAVQNLKKPNYFRNKSLEHGNFFNERILDLEFLGMTFMQRMTSFVVCLVLGAILFLYSFTLLLFIAFNPVGFVVPYVLSNFIFFFMFGFISGFKTYFKNLFNKSKRVFTGTFIVTTIMTMYVSLALKNKFYNLFFAVIQTISFICFLITFFPGGTSAIKGFVKLVARR